MEAQRRARKPVRAQVTRLCNKLEALLAVDPKDLDTIRAKQNVIHTLNQKLREMDEKLMDVLSAMDPGEPEEEGEEVVTEADKEFPVITEYQEKVETVQLKLEKVLTPVVLTGSPTSSSYSTASDGHKRRKTYKLPKTEIKKFGGDITEWLSWWAQFAKVHEDEDLHEADKFQYLVQAMIPNSKAADLVQVFPQTAANYPKVIQALQDRFGKEKILKRVYVRELLKMIIEKSKQKVSITQMFDKLEAHLKALESLGITQDQMDILLFPMVESCLPDDVLLAWQRSASFGKDGKNETPPRTEFDYMMEFVRGEVENETQRQLAQAGFGVGEEKVNEKQKNGNKSSIPTAASLSNQVEKIGWIFCSKSNHPSQECFRAQKMTMEERRDKVRDSRSCYVCLKKGHGAKFCKSSLKCSHCQKKHYKLMCPELEKKSESHGDSSEFVQGMRGLTVQPSVTSYNQEGKVNLVLMKTLHVMIKGPGGRNREVRLLFDEGSQRSYVKSSIAIEMKCPVVENVMMQNALFGGYLTDVKSRKKYEVVLGGIGSKAMKKVNLVGEEVICLSCPIIPQGPWIKDLARRKIYLTDTYSDSPEVEILVGSDLWGSFMTGKMVKLEGGLIAMESIFGWTLSGELPSPSPQNLAMLTISMLSQEEKTLPELWKLETIGIRDSAEKISEEEHEANVKENMQNAITKDDSGRYVVELPWSGGREGLPDNKAVAVRLNRATEKLIKEDKYQAYDKIFEEWENEGIIEQVQEDDSKDSHYLPHRPVFKLESLTTPVRPVFDASCRVGKYPSLNQCLEKGPNMLELIPSILLRFREKKVAAISDIRKAFQMVGVKEEDRNYQKFLWWDTEKSIKVFRHCRVVFGMNCSPFLLAAVINHHLNQVDEEDRPTAEILKKSLYVDNYVGSMNSASEYQEIKERATNIMARAQMELRQWESNVDDTEGQGNGPESSVLGMKWDKEQDTLRCDISPLNLEKLVVTKRTVLSIVSQVFDPIGAMCPALLPPKIKLQQSWADGLSWDAEWDKKEVDKFLSWSKELESLQEIRIPRCAFPYGQGQEIQLHTFCDASKNAYAAVVFARVKSGEKVSVHLLQAKSRLAPLSKKKEKNVTINRLELMSCLIGSRLLTSTTQSLSMENVPCFMWSDSTNALARIRRDENWGTFVGNRVREISRLPHNVKWRHVPGLLNPADLPSRGCSPVQVLESRWWEGPAWLLDSESSWPNMEGGVDEEAVSQEKKKVTTTAMSLEEISPPFNSYRKNVSVAAWIRRFVGNCSKRREDRCYSKYLTMSEMRARESDLLLQVQKRHFSGMPKIQGMKLRREEDKLLHVQTRLTYKEDTPLLRSPILLPKDDPIVHQLIQYIHKTNCHGGSQFVLGKLRERYWIPGGRKTVGKVIRKCVTCKRYSGRSQVCDPAPLPQARVEEAQGTFQTTGVDLAGPIILKGGKKVWIVVYTCAVYRGVYLDIVDSLSSDDFLDSLEKFTWNVGRPSQIYSDNGTNLVGAQNLLKSLNWKKIEEKVNVKVIKWTFNPPASPWWGGFWERMVRSIKELLRRMLGTAKLTKKELEKCLAAVSHTINSRPLTTLNEDGGDLIALTPLMFMRDLPVFGLPEREAITSRDLQNSYQKLANLRKSLKERFRKEYLANLIQKKNEQKGPPIEVGDVVLVGSDNRKRYE
ncbi:uncharacterized protein LOC110859612 [Folsomia candida]|uniref:uncharacterized protein LOC110859612 n=1 Tax=Folsomia candida TaxID=158441 RepID=UPI000B909138|nr:uncharacterized protein LOC110859612 [Folsomia candida]